jgi:hypothetical protein
MPRSINPNGIRRNNTAIREEGGKLIVRLYRTDIVTVDRAAGLVTFNTGGYDTPTTIRRMNEVAHHSNLLDGHKVPIRVAKADFRTSNTITYRLG